MENLVEVLNAKSEKHLGKLKTHIQAKEVLEMEFVGEENEEKKERIREKLLSTHKGIEYHKGSSKTYLKVVNMIESGKY